MHNMKIFGIPLKIEHTFLLMAVFLGYSRSNEPVLLLGWVIIVFISILAHELGHAFAGRRYGLSPQITLHLTGGLTSWDGNKTISPTQNLIVSLAGPVAGLLLGVAVWGLWHFAAIRVLADTPYHFYGIVMYNDLLWVNLGWSLFNLLPTLPLDGGQAAHSLENLFSPKTQGLIAEILTVTVGIAVATWALAGNRGWVFMIMGWCVATTGTNLLKRWQARQDVPLQGELRLVRDACNNKNGSTVVNDATKIFAKAKSDWVKRQSLDLVIRGHLLQDNFHEAQRELQRFKAHFGSDIDLEANVYFKACDWDNAILALEPAFQTTNKASYGAWLVQALIEVKEFQRALEYCQNPLLEKHRLGLFWKLQAGAFYDAQYALSNQIGVIAISLVPHSTFAYNIACGHAKMNCLNEGIHWLARAIELGFSDREDLLRDSDLESLQSHPEFSKIVARITPNNADAK